MTLARGAAPAKGTRYFEPVVVMLMRTSISSFRAADSLPLRTPHLGRVLLRFFRLKLRLTFLMPERARLSSGWVTACKCRCHRCRYWAVASRSPCPRKTWMVRKSVPASDKWAAQLGWGTCYSSGFAPIAPQV